MTIYGSGCVSELCRITCIAEKGRMWHWNASKGHASGAHHLHDPFVWMFMNPYSLNWLTKSLLHFFRTWWISSECHSIPIDVGWAFWNWSIKEIFIFISMEWHKGLQPVGRTQNRSLLSKFFIEPHSPRRLNHFSAAGHWKSIQENKWIKISWILLCHPPNQIHDQPTNNPPCPNNKILAEKAFTFNIYLFI